MAESRPSTSPAKPPAQLLEDLAHARPGLDAQLGGEIVAAQRRARRPSRCQARASASISRASSRWASTISGLASGPAAAGGEPVGGAEQGDVGGDRLGGAEVVVDRAARERALVDQEAEPQVVQREALEVAC